MTARSDTGHAPSRRENSPRAVPSTLEAVVLQLRAALAIAEAALDQGVTGRPTVYTVAEVADITGCASGARWLVSAAALDRYLSGDSSSSTTAA